MTLSPSFKHGLTVRMQTDVLDVLLRTRTNGDYHVADARGIARITGEGKKVKRVSDLISRQDAIDAMCSACGYDCDKSKFVYNAPQDEQVIMCPEHYALSTLPSAEPRKKGKWIKFNNSCTIRCNQCGKEMTSLCDIRLPNYCPNCGSYNGGEEE